MAAPTDDGRTKKDKTFHLKAEEDDFKKKSASIFAGLGDIEARHTAHVNARKNFSRESEDTYMKPDPETLIPLPRPSDGRQQPPPFPRQPQFETRQQPLEKPGFKRPHNRAPRSKSNPDYRVHPEKWTMYELDNVPRQDMTECANTSAAMDFLRQQREDKYAPEISRCKDMETDEDHKVVFHKPSEKSAETSGGPSREGKLHVAEYVVGEKRLKSTKRSHEGQAVGEVVGLGHLAHNEDEGEGGEEVLGTDSTSSEAASSSRPGDDTISKTPTLPQPPTLPQSSPDSTVEMTEAKPVAFKKSKSKSRNMRKRNDDVEEDE